MIEEKDILLKDIFARFPYDLIVQETFQKAKGNRHVWDCGPHYIRNHPEKVKPYLRPLSSITKEEKKHTCLKERIWMHILFGRQKNFLPPKKKQKNIVKK